MWWTSSGPIGCASSPSGHVPLPSAARSLTRIPTGLDPCYILGSADRNAVPRRERSDHRRVCTSPLQSMQITTQQVTTLLRLYCCKLLDCWPLPMCQRPLPLSCHLAPPHQPTVQSLGYLEQLDAQAALRCAHETAPPGRSATGRRPRSTARVVVGSHVDAGGGGRCVGGDCSCLLSQRLLGPECAA